MILIAKRSSRQLLAPRQAARELGLRAEQQVATEMSERGWSVLARNWRGGRGELDIVAEKEGALRFVEVKARQKVEDGLYAVTFSKRMKLASAAEAWIAQSRATFDEACFLLVVVVGNPPRGSTTWIDNPFDG